MGLMEVVLFGGMTAIYAVVVWLVLKRPQADRVDQWATFNGVVLADTTRPVVKRYLDNRHALRRIGAVTGVLLAPSITAAFGIDLNVSGYVWLLLGYLIGVMVAELTLARVPGRSSRVASLTTRKVSAYASPGLLVMQILLPLVAIAVAILIGFATSSSTIVVSEMQRTGALWAAPLAAVVAIGALLGQRHLVRRPQPSSDPDVLAVDDAMRSSAVRMIGATSATTSALLVSAQLGFMGNDLGRAGTNSAPLFIASMLMGVVALVCWLARLPGASRSRTDGPSAPGTPLTPIGGQR